jgi:hypothetical protein
MSVLAATLMLGALVVGLIRTRWVRFSGALVCVAFGIALAASPMGPSVTNAAGDVGSWAYQQLQSV